MPLSPCCKRKYSKPCKCSPPSNDCECVVQTGQCPPPEDSDAASVQLYTPVIAAVPASNNQCCCSCCQVKPKRSFWQQLFGDRKCCTPCQKKKQEKSCPCKPKKKQRCVPDCTNPLCHSDIIRPNPPPASKPLRPLCCCKKVKSCKCRSNKPCSPTPGSIFGCHFYCNVENKENRTKQSRGRCCCPCPQKSDQKRSGITEAIVEDVAIDKKSLVRPKPNIDKPTQSNIHIGLTLTNTETKYYTNNMRSNGCPTTDYETNEGSSESSEQIITLEIHQSSGNLDQGIKEDISHVQENNQKRVEDASSIDSHKLHKRSTLKEENERYSKKSESYSREILPQIERKRRNTGNISPSSSNSLRRKRENTMDYPVKHGDDYLDKRVSEILRRLQTIENKINKIDLSKAEDKHFKIETDGNKSTISFHFKERNLNDSFLNGNKYITNNSSLTPRKPDAVIEIRKTRSKSYSPERKSSFTESSRYRYSRSLDRGSKTPREKPKLVIKLPKGNKVSHGFVSMNNSGRVTHLNKDYNKSEWLEVSNELKNRKQMNTPCYCYECVCKRVRCG